MHQQIAPIAVRPLALSGISERMEVSLYENDYGGSVRTLNAVRRDLAALQAFLIVVINADVADLRALARHRVRDAPPLRPRRGRHPGVDGDRNPRHTFELEAEVRHLHDHVVITGWMTAQATPSTVCL